jgi:hypothetical protein
MQVINFCSLNSSLLASLEYNDNDGPHLWGGSINVFGMFWNTGGGVTSQAVTSGTAILIPTSPTQKLALVQAYVSNGGIFGLPSGFGSSTVVTTCAMAGGSTSGSNHGHGYSNTVNGMTFNGFYRDGGSNTWSGAGNIFAIAVVLNTTSISDSQEVSDSNSEIEKIVVSGTSGQTPPAWKTTNGSVTIDNSASWENTGLGTAAWTDSARWAFAYKNSITGGVSTASPVSKAMTLNANNYAFIQGPGSDDFQVDTIVIYRTVQGGSLLLEEDEIPAPPAGQLWQYVDENSDLELNPLITAAINHANDPPHDVPPWKNMGRGKQLRLLFWRPGYHNWKWERSLPSRQCVCIPG